MAGCVDLSLFKIAAMLQGRSCLVPRLSPPTIIGREPGNEAQGRPAKYLVPYLSINSYLESPCLSRCWLAPSVPVYIDTT